MALVSVIIPNYNHARYLPQRINSVLNQTYQDFELIILDDFSTDGSREVIEQYRNHPKVSHVVFNEVNSGSTFKQWKKGIELSSGDYIWLAESDDYAGDVLLDTLMKPLETDENVLLSYCQSLIVDENNDALFLCDWADPLDKDKWKHDHIEDAEKELDSYLRYRNTIPNASAVVFRKPKDLSVFDDIVGMKFSGDWLFWKRQLSRGGKIAFSQLVLNFFRMHPQTTRHLLSMEKEKQRVKELSLFVDQDSYSVFDKRYDWMLIFWFEHRSAYKGTLQYFIPGFPVKMQIRTYILVLDKILKRIKKSLFPLMPVKTQYQSS
ncbi:glycosyltransferase family 2 protein [Mucilaginibacter jinjuensis]|uniref:Glycosyltransferase n=1 Tax=Mucilaginibacter jinjuensis TaxID=1176721 RepID=A0ABY7TEF6_9SPHI|nr:glycosyltransferase [Mucilaginibacter jinjuensis]WCT14909.1 glycosyltransferase [Mucilaginibacter jinjuensis]